MGILRVFSDINRQSVVPVHSVSYPVRIYLLVFSTVIVLSNCTSPGFTEQQPVHLSVSPATTAQLVPDNLRIEVHDDGDFYDAQTVSNPASTGSVGFRLPRGYYYIDVIGIKNDIKTLYGFSDCDASGESAVANVTLRNIISIPIINSDQETIFLQDNRPSPVWDDFTQESTARCFTSTSALIMRATVVTSYSHVYIRCIIDDPADFTDDRALTALGEMTADAAILYFCKITPHDMNTDNAPYPAVRVQCETSRIIPENGQLRLENFTSDETIERPVRECRDDAITAYLTRTDELRILELRINRSLLALPSDIEGEPPTAIVVRYRDGNTDELSDWQSGSVATNPRQNPASWGYMEIMQ